jgi:hypothetical protein
MASHFTQAECIQYLGNPTGADGNANPAWESENLGFLIPPYKMKMGDIKITRIKFHKKLIPSLAEVLNEIWEKCGKDQRIIEEYNYHIFSGSYNYRPKRGGRSLSMHAFGAAIDFDAPNNAMGDSTPEFLPDSIIVKAFENHGWTWGGRWSGRGVDGMHFEYPRVK